MAIAKKGFLFSISCALIISLVGSLRLNHAWAKKLPDKAGEASLDLFDPVKAFEIKQIPLVSLTFDDASATVYDAGFPILKSNGIPATFYFLTSHLNEDWRVRLLDLQSQGWEIGSHTRNHLDLSTLSPAELVFELNQSKIDLEALGLDVDGFAYPYGLGSDLGRVVQKVKQYYSYARSTNPGYNSPIILQYTLRAHVQINTTSVEVMKGWVDTAIAGNQWLTIILHTVDNSGNTNSVTPADLSELAQYIKSKVYTGQVAAVTAKEGVKRYTQTYWQPIHEIGASRPSNLAVTNGKVLWFFNTDVSDYLFDGYEWLKSGMAYYWEWHGEYRPANILLGFNLQSISTEQVVTHYSLTDQIGEDLQLTSSVTIDRGNPFAEVRLIQVAGTGGNIAVAKMLNRRFSTVGQSHVTDGILETGMRPYGMNAKRASAFDQYAALIRILTLPNPKTISEFSSYSSAEFRGREITLAEVPYLWCVGGITFDTLNLLREAELETVSGQTSLYSGQDASPGAGITGVELGDQGMVVLNFSPPVPGNYTLSLRIKTSSSSAQYVYQVDDGPVSTRNISSSSFLYENISLSALSSQNHSLAIFPEEGGIVVDYALLFPVSRSAETPEGVSFPEDIACDFEQFLPLAIYFSQP